MVDEQHVGVDLDLREALARDPADVQCVVARRPSSSPAAARMWAPLQIEATLAPRRCASRRRSSTSFAGSASRRAPGTITVSAVSAAASSWGAVSRNISTPPRPVTTRSGRTPHTSTSYSGAPNRSRQVCPVNSQCRTPARGSRD